MANRNGVFLEGLVVGWGSIEPIILGLASTNQNIILRGTHGTSKTMFSTILAQSLGGVFRHYDASKDDMITVAGIPSQEAMKQGIVEYAKHGNTIWGAQHVLIDEISRAPKEYQNMWLQILEERKCYGFSLQLDSVIGTMNPSTYVATYKPDEAFLDRFVAMIDVPDVFEHDAKSTIKALLAMESTHGVRDPAAIQRLRDAVLAIRDHYVSFGTNETIQRAIDEYVAAFGEELYANLKKDRKSGTFSGRRMTGLKRAIMACAAYYKHASFCGLSTSADGIFVDAAEIASTYVICTLLGIPFPTINGIHHKCKNILKNLAGSDSDRIRLQIRSANKPQDKVNILKQQIDEIAKWSPAEAGSLVNMVVHEVVSFAGDKIKTLRNKTANASQTQTSIKGVWEAGKSLDHLQNALETMGKHVSPVIRAAIESAKGTARSGVFNTMSNIMQDYKDTAGARSSKVVTYEQINEIGAQVREIQVVWDGQLVKGSLEETFKMLYPLTLLNTK